MVEIATEAVTQQKSKKRINIENYVLTYMNQLDHSLLNSDRYCKFFASLTEQQFEEWILALKNGKSKLIFYAPNMKVKVRMEDILAIAKSINLELFERLRLWDASTKRYYLTPKKYLILKLPIRRLKQYLKSKLSIPESDTTTDAFTGQVIKPDKGSAISLVEMQTILSKNLVLSLTELAHVRGGDVFKYAAMKGSLEETGTANLSDLDQNSRVRSAVVLNAYLTSCHIASNF